MNIEDLSTQLLYTTMPVSAEKVGGICSNGTGFIFSAKKSENETIPLLVTNYHVLEGATNVATCLHLRENNLPTKEVVDVKFEKGVIEEGKLGELDLVALPLAGAINELQREGKNVFYRSIDASLVPDCDMINDLAAIETVTFIGYPNSVIDKHNQLPIVRQGVSATPIWNNYEGEEQFLVDAGVYPGSSGSPVFIYNQGSYVTREGIAIGNRILFVGIMTQTLQRATDNAYLNLGVVINSKAIFRELDKFIYKKMNISIVR